MNFLLPCYFEKTWLLWLVCLKCYYFFCQYELLFWIIWIWTFMPQYREIYWIMLGSIPHQKFCFYHLPTRGRACIKLGDAWYVSNVSIILDGSMLLSCQTVDILYASYIFFGTNLLTQCQVPVPIFSVFLTLFRG